MADSPKDNSIRKNSKGSINLDGPGEPRIEPPIKAPINSSQQMSETVKQNDDQRVDILRERMERYAKLVADQKKKMMDVDKEKLIDVIFKQNSLITQQSNQMMDLVNLVNELDASASQMSEGSHASQNNIAQNSEELQRNIDILRKRNELCQEANQMRQDGARLYSNSVRIQFVLFTLFILVLLWLLYHYMSFNE